MMRVAIPRPIRDAIQAGEDLSGLDFKLGARAGLLFRELHLSPQPELKQEVLDWIEAHPDSVDLNFVWCYKLHRDVWQQELACWIAWRSL